MQKKSLLTHDSFLLVVFHTEIEVAQGTLGRSSRQSPQFTFHIFLSLDTSTMITWAHSQHFNKQ